MTSLLVKFAYFLLVYIIIINPRYGDGTSPSPSSIIDGQFADENEFKYLVAIRENGYDFHGAGSIIHPEWIITARHVVVQTYDDNVSSYFNFSAMEPIYVYPKYLNNLTHFYEKGAYRAKHLYCLPIPDDTGVYSSDNDIALVQLEYPIPLGPDTKYKFEKIEWNTKRINFDRGEIKLIAAGWGLVKKCRGKTSIFSDYLRTARYKSRRPLKSADFRPYQQFAMINPKHGICDGDSGGPVVIRDRSGKDLLVGIISYGPFYCDGPSGQQNVEFYKDWIEEIVEDGDPVENLRKYDCKNFYGKEYNNI